MPKKIKKELDCLLTPEELSEKAIKASEKKHEARMLKEKAAGLEKEAKELDEQVANKRTKRMVECIEDQILATNTVIITRTDDPKYWPDGLATVGEPRAMTGDERQLVMHSDPDDEDQDAPKVTTKAPRGRGKRSKQD